MAWYGMAWHEDWRRSASVVPSVPGHPPVARSTQSRQDEGERQDEAWEVSKKRHVHYVDAPPATRGGISAVSPLGFIPCLPGWAGLGLARSVLLFFPLCLVTWFFTYIKDAEQDGLGMLGLVQ